MFKQHHHKSHFSIPSKMKRSESNKFKLNKGRHEVINTPVEKMLPSWLICVVFVAILTFVRLGNGSFVRADDNGTMPSNKVCMIQNLVRLLILSYPACFVANAANLPVQPFQTSPHERSIPTEHF
jgi:hypothetical protein